VSSSSSSSGNVQLDELERQRLVEQQRIDVDVDLVVELRVEQQGLEQQRRLELEWRLARLQRQQWRDRIEWRVARTGPRAADGPAVRRRRRGIDRAQAVLQTDRLTCQVRTT